MFEEKFFMEEFTKIGVIGDDIGAHKPTLPLTRLQFQSAIRSEGKEKTACWEKYAVVLRVFIPFSYF